MTSCIPSFLLTRAQKESRMDRAAKAMTKAIEALEERQIKCQNKINKQTTSNAMKAMYRTEITDNRHRINILRKELYSIRSTRCTRTFLKPMIDAQKARSGYYY